MENTQRKGRGSTLYLPDELIIILDRVRKDRRDPTRSDTIRFLILRALAELSYLPEMTKKGLGIKNEAK
jgi:metal-responsive CopG/Arc/MetJ family transcriptional regulator